MKKKIIGIFVCMLLITISVCTLSASADPESELRAGGIIWNDGLDTIRDVQYTFTIRGGYDNSINITISDDAGDGDIEVNQVYTISTNEAKGYGPVTITMTVTLSNAGEVTATSQGFQIGPYTISKTYLMAWC
jgi:lipopolysaccharide export LptBFGC system permease protein LptF